MTARAGEPLTSGELDELERLAEAATPGPYAVIRYRHGAGRIYVGNDLIADLYHEDDREFFAALSPEVVLRLIAALRAARTPAGGLDLTRWIDSLPENHGLVWVTKTELRQVLGLSGEDAGSSG